MFERDVIEAAKEHALAEYPREAVGFVVAGVYEPQENVAGEDEKEFAVDDNATLDALQRGLQAVIHSHPDGPEHPSGADMRQQLVTAVPWGIIVVRNGTALDPFWWGDGVPKAPLLERSFRHGVHDCYSLIRDYYAMEWGIALADCPRDNDWWHAGGDLYMENFRAWGFEPIAGEPQVGDVALMQIHSPVVNHAAIYLGDGLIMHHLTNRLSRREPVFGWRKMIVHWVRYTGAKA